MNFIKKIAERNFDDDVHLQFQKFSKGEFRDRAIIKAKKSGKKYSINTSAEFVNEIVKMCAEKLGDGKTKITGAIVSTSDLTGELEFKEKKQFQGVKRYLINSEMSGREILELLRKFPKSFFALTFDVSENTKLKTKPKAPKSGKPGSGGEEPKADFCKLITDDEKIGKSFIFEKPEFKNAEVKHNFFIERIEIPFELKDSKDFAKVREESKRIGKIFRIAKIDEQKFEKEFGFEA